MVQERSGIDLRIDLGPNLNFNPTINISEVTQTGEFRISSFFKIGSIFNITVSIDPYNSTWELIESDNHLIQTFDFSEKDTKETPFINIQSIIIIIIIIVSVFFFKIDRRY